MTERSLLKTTLRDAVWVGMIGLLLLLSCIIWSAVTTSPGMDAKQSKAQLGSASIVQAMEAYIDHPSNLKYEFPNTLHDLVMPPFGVPSFLKNGEAALLDPWGKQYEMERRRRSDGSEYIIVRTPPPDGTPISQFGIGPQAEPKQ